MTDFFTPKFSITSSWRSSIQIINQTLNRIKFVIEDNFSFGNFNLTLTPSGFGFTNGSLLISRAKYLKISKFLWISINFKFLPNALTGGPMWVTATLPYNMAVDTQARQGGGCLIIVETLPFTFEAGYWTSTAVEASTKIELGRSALVNFTADVTRIALNTFIEVQ